MKQQGEHHAGSPAPMPVPRADDEVAPVQQRERRSSSTSHARQQAARLARLKIASVFASLYLLVLGLFYLLDRIDLPTLLTAVVLIVVAQVGFYTMFATGLNLRFRTKNLRTPMMVSVVGIMLFVGYLEPYAQIAFIPFLLLTLAFVMHRMSSRTMLRLSLATQIVYGIVIWLHYRQFQDESLLTLELMQWLALCMALPGFVMLADRVQHLHSALYKANRKIRDIQEDAQRDVLLGCYNRRYIVAALEQQKRLADTTGDPLCLAVIDLDHFKRINDEAGHLAGDEVLRVFSRIAQSNVRNTDVFGRYGGEEFLLVLPQTSLQAALNIAERIRMQVEQYDWSDALRNGVTISIGLTQHIGGESVLDLFSRTDSAMYQAKQAGRNRVVVEPSTQV